MNRTEEPKLTPEQRHLAACFAICPRESRAVVRSRHGAPVVKGLVRDASGATFEITVTPSTVLDPGTEWAPRVEVE